MQEKSGLWMAWHILRSDGAGEPACAVSIVLS